MATHVGILSEGRLVVEDSLERLRSEQSPELELRIDDPARAATLLRGRDLSVAERGSTLIVPLRPGHNHDLTCASLNAALVEAGIGVFAIGAGRRRWRARLDPAARAPSRLEAEGNRVP